MAQRRPFNQQRRKFTPRGGAPVPVELPKPLPRAVPKVYGPPIILLEDEKKKVFEYQSGAWVAYERTIAECRLDCQVKELPQKVNKMTRYEVRLPVA